MFLCLNVKKKRFSHTVDCCYSLYLLTISLPLSPDWCRYHGNVKVQTTNEALQAVQEQCLLQGILDIRVFVAPQTFCIPPIRYLFRLLLIQGHGRLPEPIPEKKEKKRRGTPQTGHETIAFYTHINYYTLKEMENKINK